jgi:hypothetical protein
MGYKHSPGPAAAVSAEKDGLIMVRMLGIDHLSDQPPPTELPLR